ncbi:hypothetical protein [Micromonospora sp. NPDC049301]|uniref:hypothetical protein n=1 Tax=Micromonospora sp. NPDC049301 TaxID=3155723 RepID=UPI00342B47A5
MKVRTVLLPAAAVAATFVMATPASAAPAYETNYAVRGTPPSSGLSCRPVSGVLQACFEAYGDKWWLRRDSSAYSGVGIEWENYRNGSLYRNGECVSYLPVGTWGVCNKDYYEDSTLSWAPFAV